MLYLRLYLKNGNNLSEAAIEFVSMGDGVYISLTILADNIMYDVTNAILTRIREFCNDGNFWCLSIFERL